MHITDICLLCAALASLCIIASQFTRRMADEKEVHYLTVLIAILCILGYFAYSLIANQKSNVAIGAFFNLSVLVLGIGFPATALFVFKNYALSIVSVTLEVAIAMIGVILSFCRIIDAPLCALFFIIPSIICPIWLGKALRDSEHCVESRKIETRKDDIIKQLS